MDTGEMKANFVYLTKPDTQDRFQGVRVMWGIMEEMGFDRKRCRSAFMVEGRWNGKKPSATDIKNDSQRFVESLGGPSILVVMGAGPMTPLTKSEYPITEVRGEPMPVTEKMGLPAGSLIYGMFDPIALVNNPSCEDLFRRDLRHLKAIMDGRPEENPKVDNIVVHTAEEVEAFAEALPGIMESLPPDDRFLVVDCEWEGRNWLEPGHYIRTVQVGYAPGCALTVELYRENPKFETMDFPRKARERKEEIRKALLEPVCMCPDIDRMWKALKALLQDSGHPIVGHNVIADWQWLLTFGVDIRKNVIFDTMLAEHLVNSDGPFRLDEVAMRRTPYGRYCAELELWVRKHGELVKTGYGAVPWRLLAPYGGYDVDCPRMIMKAQIKLLAEYGMLDPRGPNGEYPSLFESSMLNELATDELERNGLPVDRQRLTELIDTYQGMKAQLLSEVVLIAKANGMEDFNPDSQPQMREMMFGRLGLPPVKTTDGQAWGEAMSEFGADDEDAPSSSTDKAVLEMLQDRHPFVKKALQLRRIAQACKTWLRHPDPDTGKGGLEEHLWADGKLHAVFLPLTSTGRYKTSKPNSQNWPKKADGYLKEIFIDNVPPMLRTIVKPPDGWMMMEGDFKQAELFTLANISGDKNMIRLLTTPGLDLHDSTTLSAFKMKMLDESDNEVTEEDLMRLAAEKGAESEEFEHYMKTLRYLQVDGKLITRAAFKAGPRINAKSLNFGQ